MLSVSVLHSEYIFPVHNYCTLITGDTEFFSRVESCSNKCQVTTCGACIYVKDPVDLPEECVKEKCETLRCVVRWSKCAYKQIQTFQV